MVSDIDVVVILDEVRFDDLQSYRAMLDTLEHRSLVCGFVAGEGELLGWEKSDLLQLVLDTCPIVGTLDSLRLLFSDSDVRRAVLVGACNIYHACSHNFLHERDTAALAGLYKAARFTVRMKHYLDTGEYIASMNRLAGSLSADSRRILDRAVAADGDISGETFEADSCMLLDWAGKVIREMETE